MLELYHHNTSVCAAKVRLALEEKGVAWESRYVDILIGEQFRPEYMKVNPKAVVPTLVHNGIPIRESTVMNEYIDETFPGEGLRPKDPVEQARMRLWTKVPDEGLHMACGTVTFVTQHRQTILQKLSGAALDDFLARTFDPVWRERKKNWVLKGVDAPDVKESFQLYDKAFADMENDLKERKWLSGGGFSLADIALAPYVNRIFMLGLVDMWASRPRLQEWFERIKSRPAFQKAVMNWIPEEVVKSMRNNGTESWPQVKRILQTV